MQREAKRGGRRVLGGFGGETGQLRGDESRDDRGWRDGAGERDRPTGGDRVWGEFKGVRGAGGVRGGGRGRPSIGDAAKQALNHRLLFRIRRLLS